MMWIWTEELSSFVQAPLSEGTEHAKVCSEEKPEIKFKNCSLPPAALFSGDSGNGLLRRAKHPRLKNKRYFVEGIVSHGEKCANSKSMAPSYFSRVQFRLEWIKAVMKVSGEFDDCNPFCRKKSTKRNWRAILDWFIPPSHHSLLFIFHILVYRRFSRTSKTLWPKKVNCNKTKFNELKVFYHSACTVLQCILSSVINYDGCW